MLLGLATLTTMAHALAAASHLAYHGAGDWPLYLLLAFAPIAGPLLAMRDRPRHGALLLAIVMIAAAWWTLYAHYWLLDHVPDTFVAAWIVQMMLAFEIQGAALGLLLIVKPEVPRPAEPARGAA